MKLAIILLALTAGNLWAQDLVQEQEKALGLLREKQQKAMDEYKAKNKDWAKLPNKDYEEFFSDWANDALNEELELRKDFCDKDEKLCLKDTEVEALKAQTRVAVKVVELRNAYAETKPTKAEQKEVNEQIERAANVKLCQEHGKNCEKLSQKDRDLVEQLKQRDARIAGMESEFAIKHPEWQEKKGDKEVKDFLVRRENELLSLNLKLNDHLCHEYPKDKEFCLEHLQIKELEDDTARTNCQHERLHQLYNMTKEDLKSKEKILIAGHKAQWESLEKRDCKHLLAQDRLGESLVPPPVVVAPPKEEVFGENVDEKDPENFDPESCEWVTDLPRRVSFIPGCGKKGVCNGYVVCNQKKGGGKFVRISTCSPSVCGGSKKDAVACTKQPGYHSRRAKDEDHEFVSEKLKRIFSGASKQ